MARLWRCRVRPRSGSSRKAPQHPQVPSLPRKQTSTRPSSPTPSESTFLSPGFARTSASCFSSAGSAEERGLVQSCRAGQIVALGRHRNSISLCRCVTCSTPPPPVGLGVAQEWNSGGQTIDHTAKSRNVRADLAGTTGAEHHSEDAQAKPKGGIAATTSRRPHWPRPRDPAGGGPAPHAGIRAAGQEFL